MQFTLETCKMLKGSDGEHRNSASCWTETNDPELSREGELEAGDTLSRINVGRRNLLWHVYVGTWTRHLRCGSDSQLANASYTFDPSVISSVISLVVAEVLWFHSLLDVIPDAKLLKNLTLDHLIHIVTHLHLLPFCFLPDLNLYLEMPRSWAGLES